MNGQLPSNQSARIPTSELRTYPSSRRQFAPHPVGIGNRFLPRLLDIVIFGVIALCLFMVFSLLLSVLLLVSLGTNADGATVLGKITELLTFIAHPNWFYVYGYLMLMVYELLPLARYGGSFGKLLLGFRVVDATTLNLLSIKQACIRTAVLVLPLAILHVGWHALLAMAASAGAAFPLPSQLELFVFVIPLAIVWLRVHERMSGTIVVKGYKPVPTMPYSQAGPYPPQYPQPHQPPPSGQPVQPYPGQQQTTQRNSAHTQAHHPQHPQANQTNLPPHPPTQPPG